MRFTALTFTLLLVAACATPVSHTNIPLSSYDKDTEYGVEERPDGFGITVYYSRYQFIPEMRRCCYSMQICTYLYRMGNRGEERQGDRANKRSEDSNIDGPQRTIWHYLLPSIRSRKVEITLS